MPNLKIIPFKTAYGEKERIHCNAGTGYQPIFGYEIDSLGRKTLVKTGEKDLYTEIQSYKEEVSIESVLARVAVGDMSDFRPNGIYADISEIPNNLIEAKKEMQKLENMWNKLPTETKEKYGWSVETFIAEAGKESWLIDTGFLVPKEEEPIPVASAAETETPLPETKE